MPGEPGSGRAGRLFVLPAVVLITLFFFVPVAAAFLLSFTDFDLYGVGSNCPGVLLDALWSGD